MIIPLFEHVWCHVFSIHFNHDCFYFSCADNVMACILADYGPVHDVTINIEHTLLEAYCMENDIKVLKVNITLK